MKRPKLIQELLETTVTPEEIIYLVKEMAKRHDEDNEVADMYTAVMILADQGDHRPGKSFAIMERLRCLKVMMKDDRMKGWTRPGPEAGCSLTSEPVFRATALCPLRYNSRAKKVWFDAETFFNLVWQEAGSEGNA